MSSNEDPSAQEDGPREDAAPRRAQTDAARGDARAPRLLLYSHDGLGLGHMRRNVAIACALARLAPGSSILLATSSDEVDALADRPPNVDVLKLPSIRKTANDRYVSRRLSLSWREIRAVRARLLTAAAESFLPDVLLADKHPTGVGGELTEALELVRAADGRCALGLRDIIDDPQVVRAEWTAANLGERIARYHDRILVYGQPDLVDPVRDYGLPDAVAPLVRFCGYVVHTCGGAASESDAEERLVPDARPAVVATAGGGEDGSAVLEHFVEAAAGAVWNGIAVAGPHCAGAERRRLHDLASAAGVEFRTVVRNLAHSFGSAAALVCMGGYNTLVEAAASGVPTICVPRVQPRIEQLLRARAFARLGLVRVVEPGQLDATRLRREVELALAAHRPTLARRARTQLDLGGADAAARELLELALEGAARHEPTEELTAV